MSPTDAPVESAAVALRDVSMAFGGKTVLASVSLDIAPGRGVARRGAHRAGHAPPHNKQSQCRIHK
ncbi:hypothetical protein [Streptomyces mirabilis]|uniref:hypothetical protein n=1 Tax=Streptomyces mirabilis TaxID=68239 RepID=UPI0036B4B47D